MIGDKFGGRDHSTVIHASKCFAEIFHGACVEILRAAGAEWNQILR
jgi:hypothetical protein